MLSALLFISFVVPASALARNMSATHGNDYEFTLHGESFFPVVWDVRGAWLNYFEYGRSYIESRRRGSSQLLAFLEKIPRLSDVWCVNMTLFSFITEFHKGLQHFVKCCCISK